MYSNPLPRRDLNIDGTRFKTNSIFNSIPSKQTANTLHITESTSWTMAKVSEKTSMIW
jgi:hypothetical protein